MVFDKSRRVDIKAVFALLCACGVNSLVSAVTFPLTVNVDAEVTFTGSQTAKVTVSANTQKSVDLAWLTATSDVKVSVKSLNTKFSDTTFTTKIESNTVKYPAWDKSKTYASKDTVSHNNKNWAAGWETSAGQEPGTTGEWGVWKEVVGSTAYNLSIVLSAKPLSLDSAYIPLRANVAVKVRAVPISMISGVVPSQPYEFQIAAKTTDTIVVPVKTGSTAIAANSVRSNASISLSKLGTTNLLSLPASYQNGSLALISSAGRKLGSIALTAEAQHDLSVWDVAPGIYLIHLRDVAGTVAVKKIQHGGGDLKIATSFSTQFSVGGLVNSRIVSNETRAATAQYRFEITPVDSKYSDSTHTVSLAGQMNPLQNYYLVDPTNPTGNLEVLLDSATYEKLFPNRYGKGFGAYINDPLPANPTRLTSDGDYDFFTHESLIKAADSISRIEVQVYQREGHPYMHRLVWKDKKTGQTRTMINNVAYNDFTNKEFLAGTVDYANFCNEGDAATRKQELAAFLGNISHETTGGGNEEKKKTWGLYWREEVAWQNGGTGTGYRDEGHATYKPTAGKSYHGRGPIQISWNYNYGQVSEFLYGDKQILLDNPEKVCPPKPQDATLSFMTAIWFWMTPQAPKPSCHDVMVGNWKPTAADIAANRHTSKFGMTVNIINGGLECGIPTDHRVEDRIGFYKRYIGLMGETPESNCECSSMGKL